MFFDELNNDEWALLAVLVSDEPAIRLNRRGRPRAEPRIVANAVLWILTTGEPWSKLPGRYPSGPTCRRRFEDWQQNGTLLEMVRLLSQTGRTFAYVPQAAPPATAKPVTAQAAPAAIARDDTLRGVSWKSPGSWQAPGQSNGSGGAFHGSENGALHGALSGWRAADPIADITRQLSGAGLGQGQPVCTERHIGAPDTGVRMQASLQPRAEVKEQTLAQMLDTEQSHDDRRSSLTMSLTPRGTEVADRRGYLIYVAAEPVPNAMYRAWAEILHDGRRVERSGLVGPRFVQADEAEQYALDWARSWIDRECRTQNAAPRADVAEAQANVAQVADAIQVATHTVCDVDQALAAANAVAHAIVPPGVARPLPPIRHVPEPVAVTHNAPLHGPIGALRGPVRRYSSEPAAPAASAADEPSSGTSSDRLPAFPELLSHAR